jgi:hypothetical protein
MSASAAPALDSAAAVQAAQKSQGTSGYLMSPGTPTGCGANAPVRTFLEQLHRCEVQK